MRSRTNLVAERQQCLRAVKWKRNRFEWRVESRKVIAHDLTEYTSRIWVQLRYNALSCIRGNVANSILRGI